MKDKPKYAGETTTEEHPDFFEVCSITSNGKDLMVNFKGPLIPHFSEQLIDKACFVLRDAFYRVRPDLRRQ